MEWELSRHPWASLGAAGSAAAVPDALRDLVGARDAAAARDAYWRIDNTVVVQGALHEAAEATASVAVVALGRCGPAGRARLLELLGQIGAGEAADADLVTRCQREVARGYPIYALLAETTREPEELTSVVDLLGISARADATLRSRVRGTYERLLQVDLTPGVRKLVTSWLEEVGDA